MHNSLMMQLIGEFIGTAFVVLLGDGVCAAVNLKKSKANGAGWIAIALGWGLAVTLSVYFVSWLSPRHFNPAVTIAMAAAGKFAWSSVLPYIIAQVAGAFVGAVMVWLTYYPHWAETTDQELILGTFSTEPAIRNYFWNFFAEVVGTFIFIYGLLAFTKANIPANLNPILAGLLIAGCVFSVGGITGYAINPARDFGPRLAHQLLPIANKGKSDWAYSWVPVVGPIVGGLLAALLFKAIA
ncbi:MIP/aquaporin family protein [Lactobacillus bombicola]|uniref:Aquaporin n=1 Tax=Lactobacillus bombicola TaxID=1505723 RepID=A0A396T0F8_9LACO|nr:MIP/aquaporin family protein [Lactobacillus bombicola]RHW55329.1 aquaporin [Lactobacillus bombicola]